MREFCCEEFGKHSYEIPVVGGSAVLVIGSDLDGYYKLNLNFPESKRWLHKAAPYLEKIKYCPFCGKKLKNQETP